MSSTINGFYAAYLSGKTGPGFAMFVLRSGQVAGADTSGVILDGVYTEDSTSNGHVVNLMVKTPPNIQLLQGVFSGPKGESYDLKIHLPNDFDSRDFVRIETPLGPINAKFVNAGLDD